MREIKFRAWDKTEKKMLHDFQWITSKDPHMMGGCHIRMQHVIQGRNTALGSGASVNFEIMQYTEFKDKNGVEIYEGDIFSFEWKDQGGESNGIFQGVVICLPGGFELRWANNLYSLSLMDYRQSTGDLIWVENYGPGEPRYYEIVDLKLVGNIYETPELLNVSA